jgi:hypothetical protein
MNTKERLADAIHGRNLLVTLSIGSFSFRKFDRRVTAQVTAAHGASASAGRFNKFILDGANGRIDRVHQAIRATYRLFDAETSEWHGRGVRLLPTAHFSRFSGLMRAAFDEIEEAFRDFAAHYPEDIETARASLNGLFNEADYPSPALLTQRFRWSVDYTPLPRQGDLRLDLPDEVIAQIEADIAARVRDSLAEAQADSWKRLYDAVTHVATVLTDGKRLHGSVLDNVREVTDLLATLNPTGDPDLERLRRLTAETLGGHDTEALKQDEALKAKVAADATDLSNAMKAFYKPR